MFKAFNHIQQVIIVIIELDRESVRYRACRVKRNDKNFPDIPLFDSISDIVKKFGKTSPYALHFIGTGILNRLTDNISNYKEQLLVNADVNSFQFTSFSDSTRKAVSFIRKDLTFTYLEEVQRQKLFLLSLSSGYVPLFVFLEKKCITTLNTEFDLAFADQHIKLFQRSDDKKNAFDYFDRLAWSIASPLFEKNPAFEQAIEAIELDKNKQEYIYFRRYSILGAGSVLTLLMLVLMNYFYQRSLNNDVVTLEEELLLHSENLNLLDRLKQEKERKTLLIQNSGIKSKQFISFYLDRIASSVPASIRLKKCTIFPLKEALKENRKVEFEQTKIEISGVAGGSKIFENWLERLNRFAWVESVEVTNFSKSAESNSVFSLIIWVKL